MQTWQQLYSPLGSLGLSALAAVIPIVFFFLANDILAAFERGDLALADDADVGAPAAG